jgi:hypothetical protein
MLQTPAPVGTNPGHASRLLAEGIELDIRTGCGCCSSNFRSWPRADILASASAAFSTDGDCSACPDWAFISDGVVGLDYISAKRQVVSARRRSLARAPRSLNHGSACVRPFIRARVG